MRKLAERPYFLACRTLGRMLRAARYATARIVRQDGELHVRKRRARYAPVLVWLGGPLVRILDTGVRVLSQREWEEREARLYQSLYGTSIRVEHGTLVLPCLAGETLATLLEDPGTGALARTRAIELAVTALAELHRQGYTHGDAMAENVMVDLAAGTARWFDFETVHEPDRSVPWRRADDVRALLASCLLRAARDDVPGMLRLILDRYGDDGVTRLAAASFESAMVRPLAFHLGQAGISFGRFREISRLLGERTRPVEAHA